MKDSTGGRDECHHPMTSLRTRRNGSLWCLDCDMTLSGPLHPDRAELIPADLAPRITQMVIDDLRAAGWTVEPPVDHGWYRHHPSYGRERLEFGTPFVVDEDS